MEQNIKCLGRQWTRRECLLALGGAAVGTIALASGIGWLTGNKTPYELGQKQIDEYQKLCRPKIEELLGAGSYDRCCAAMWNEYEMFAAQLPTFEDKNNRGVFYRNAPFILSLYRALRGEFALNQDQALDALGHITDYKVRQSYGNDLVMNPILAHVADSSLCKKLFLSVWEREVEPYGWVAEFPESDAYIAVDIIRCGLVDWYTEQGAPEVATVGCQGDFIMAEFMTGLELKRTTTIADGDEVCEFRYRKTQI